MGLDRDIKSGNSPSISGVLKLRGWLDLEVDPEMKDCPQRPDQEVDRDLEAVVDVEGVSMFHITDITEMVNIALRIGYRQKPTNHSNLQCLRDLVISAGIRKK